MRGGTISQERRQSELGPATEPEPSPTNTTLELPVQPLNKPHINDTRHPARVTASRASSRQLMALVPEKHSGAIGRISVRTDKHAGPVLDSQAEHAVE